MKGKLGLLEIRAEAPLQMQATQNLPNIPTAECTDAKDSSTPSHVFDCFVKMKCVYCDEHSFHRAMG